MQDVLKGWLASNTVSDGNKGDKILVLESAGNLMLGDVLSEMKKEDTGLRKETLVQAVDLIYGTLAVTLSALQSMYSVGSKEAG